jgi:nitrile hydratase beta subunit-like protein
MKQLASQSAAKANAITWADREAPVFAVGDPVRISRRVPIGHYRVPTYLRGKEAVVEKIIEPAAVDNEEEGYGRNAGRRRHYYRIAVPMRSLWPEYRGSGRDGLRIEVFETWLEKV